MFPQLFQSGRIGTMSLKNRIIVASVSTNLAARDGTASDRLISHYAERARGGAGLITVENVCIAYPLARHGAAQPRNDDDAFIPGLRYIAGETPVAPSALPWPKDGLIPRAPSREEIVAVIEQYVDAARRARQAGFDAVQLQACHVLLTNQFLSPLTNERQDSFGGSREGRCGFLAQIVTGIKSQKGSDFPVMVRLVGEDTVEGGVTLAGDAGLPVA